MNEVTKPNESLALALARDDVKDRFNKVLGKESPIFVSSLLSLVNSNTDLKKATQQSILSAAMMAASLKLPINPNFGFAYIIPYKHKGRNGSVDVQAQFQMGYKAYIQLAQRTGKYEALTVNEVYEGEIKNYNRFTDTLTLGERKVDAQGNLSTKVVGYLAYFKLTSGTKKYLYWDIEKVKAHGKKYSFAYRSGYKDCLWITDFDSMAKKTLIKQLISKYGIISVETQNAMSADNDDGVGQAQRNSMKIVTDEAANQKEIGFSEEADTGEAQAIEAPAVQQKNEPKVTMPHKAF